jgi:DNA-binding transcriptional ArsR family regulator
MEERRFKEQVYELVARIAKAADSPRRLEILEVLAQGPRTVESLANETALSVANASRHLQVLRQAGLVEGRKQGLFVEYRLRRRGVRSGLLRAIAGAGRRRRPPGPGLSRAWDGLCHTREESFCAADPWSWTEPRRIRRPHRGVVSFPSASCPDDWTAGGRRSLTAVSHCLMAFDAVKTLRRHGGAPAGSRRGSLNGGSRCWSRRRSEASWLPY